jgi:hypothetical protein
MFTPVVKWLSIYCELAGGDLDRVVHLSSAISAVPQGEREGFRRRLREYLAASGVRAHFE